MTAIRRRGLEGPLTIHGAAHDVVRSTSGTNSAKGSARLRAEVDFTSGTLIELSSSPSRDLGALIGTGARGGFRRRSADLLADREPTGSPLRQLVDDIPVVVLVSGTALAERMSAAAAVDKRLAIFENVCEGGRTGSTMMTRLPDGSRPRENRPTVADDILTGVVGWQDLPPLEPTDFRRLRRLDVWMDETIRFEGLFRDSYAPAVGPHVGKETVVHEYEIRGRVDPTNLTLLDVSPVSRVLPWPECPAALVSAQRAVGQPVDEFRLTLGGELNGVGTCTHLTDMLRTIADLPAMASQLDP